ncbi:MAG: TonB-dependent receptor [Alphaproteobacteria bacterium]
MCAAKPALATEYVPPVVISATRTPVAVERYPGMATVLSGESLRARGATDLRTALSLVAGVDAPPGGDAGPGGRRARAVGPSGIRRIPSHCRRRSLWRRVHPALPVLDLRGVERLEILRGAAPVTYSATSFVGVIQVFHYAAGETPEAITLAGGNRDHASGFAAFDLPRIGAFRQSLTVSADHSGFAQARSEVSRVRGLYRLAGQTGIGTLRLDLEGVSLRQDPYSPHPREGASLTPRFPFDANIDPRDAKADQERAQGTLGLASDLGFAEWETTASLGYTLSRNTRGFLRSGFAVDGVTPNADGFRQRVHQLDAYLDTHLSFAPLSFVTVTTGVDWIRGRGVQRSANFEYAVFPTGSNAPVSTSLPTDERTRAYDRRNFYGFYGSAIWSPDTRLLLSAGLRLNRTTEARSGSVDFTDPLATDEASTDTRSKWRLSGAVGASYALWQDDSDEVRAFVNYRDTFKPAAVDFGPEGDGEILLPETAKSWEGGLKGTHAHGTLDWELSYFDMRFTNLVIRENVGNLPSLANAGRERFRGGEFELDWHASEDLTILLNYARHESKFTDYARLSGGVLQQLAGKYLELAPKTLAGGGFIYAPEEGLQANGTARYVGERFLNKSNTARAKAYLMIDASLGYAKKDWSLMLRGQNLTDRRDPVAESEIGDAQFYTMPGRVVLLELSRRF